VFIDELMAKAGYVQGDDADIQQPVILHKDNDYMNCSSDNLEFVEYKDERYKAFIEQCIKDKHEKTVEKNPGKDVPDNYWY
jgi:DNA polymerase sigma